MEFNKLIPELSVSDIGKSLDFYRKIGFKLEYSREGFAFLSFQGSQMMIEQMNNNWNTGEMIKPYGRGINFQIEVENMADLIKKIKANSFEMFKGPEDNWYEVNGKLLGCRELLIQDPDGYLLRFSQEIGERQKKA